jgi:hypothetical protein
VWFPTGSGYDPYLAKALPGFKTENLDYPGISRIHGLEELLAPGGVALRTYIRSGQKDSGSRPSPATLTANFEVLGPFREINGRCALYRGDPLFSIKIVKNSSPRSSCGAPAKARLGWT